MNIRYPIYEGVYRILTYVLSLSKEGMLILSGVSVRPWQAGGDYTGSIKPNE